MAPQENDIRIPGMNPDDSEAFVMALQSVIYQMLDKYAEAIHAKDEARKLYEETERSSKWQGEKVAATLRFLSIYNSDAHDDWFAAVGMEHLRA